MKNQAYRETQAFSQKWVFVVLTVVMVALIAGYVCQTKYHISFGNKPMSIGAYITCSVLVAITMLLLYIARLQIRIDERGISYKFPPFEFSFKLYSWANLDEAYVRSFSPLGEYGGWGLRIGPNGTAVIITGGQGIQLVTKTGDHILIGTSNPRAASEAIAVHFQKNILQPSV